MRVLLQRQLNAFPQPSSFATPPSCWQRMTLTESLKATACKVERYLFCESCGHVSYSVRISRGAWYRCDAGQMPKPAPGLRQDPTLRRAIVLRILVHDRKAAIQSALALRFESNFLSCATSPAISPNLFYFSGYQANLHQQLITVAVPDPAPGPASGSVGRYALIDILSKAQCILRYRVASLASSCFD